MSQSPHEHKHMEDLVAVAGQVEAAGAPPLGDAGDVEDGAEQIGERHGRLVGQDEVAMRVVPVEEEGVEGRNEAEEAHGDEEEGAERAVLGGGEGRGEEGGDGAEAQEGDPGEVDEVPVWGALEDVVDGGEEGGDDHHGDADVVEVEEAAIQGVGVAGEEVADAAGEEAEHGPE